MALRELNKEEFAAEVINAATPVVVEFNAPWCVYCKRLAPVLGRLEAKFGAELPIVTVDIDQQPELEEKYDISLIPTLLLFKNGECGEKLVAPQSQVQVEEWINAQL